MSACIWVHSRLIVELWLYGFGTIDSGTAVFVTDDRL